jgi:hypothetical protein
MINCGKNKIFGNKIMFHYFILLICFNKDFFKGCFNYNNIFTISEYIVIQKLSIN